MSKLNVVEEQTQYLFEAQKQACKACAAKLEELLKSVQEYDSSSVTPADKISLDSVERVLSKRAEEIKDFFDEDISFLKSQLEAISEVKKIEDVAKRTELENTLLEDVGEIQDTAEFKKEVSEEVAQSRDSLIAVVEDMLNALKEGGIKELEAFVEALEVAGGEDDDDDCGDCGDCDLDIDEEGIEELKKMAEPLISTSEDECDEDDDACCGCPKRGSCKK
ncbi:hypothetical protein HOD08_04435 [bacterium]|nr:hypothetical protein [bacterium]